MPSKSMEAASATNYAIISHYPDWAQEGATHFDFKGTHQGKGNISIVMVVVVPVMILLLLTAVGFYRYRPSRH